MWAVHVSHIEGWRTPEILEFAKDHCSIDNYMLACEDRRYREENGYEMLV